MKDDAGRKAGTAPAPKRTIILVMAIVVLLVLLAALAVAFSPKPKAMAEADRSVETLILKKATIAGFTKDDYFVVYTMASNDDKAGATQMIEQGRAFLLTAGTKVSVLMKHLANVEIRVEDGPMVGKQGWAPIIILR